MNVNVSKAYNNVLKLVEKELGSLSEEEQIDFLAEVSADLDDQRVALEEELPDEEGEDECDDEESEEDDSEET
jgi:hypothetical protein